MTPVVVGSWAPSWLAVPGWMHERDTVLLIVVLLLCLLLWMLVRRREEEQRQRPRPTPLTADELGRMVMHTALSRDLWTWRSLFLNGHEADALFGPQAEGYQRARNPRAMTQLLEQIAQQIPPHATFVGTEAFGDSEWRLRVRSESGEISAIYMGAAVVIGPAKRLIGPASWRPGAAQPAPVRRLSAGSTSAK